MCVCVCIMSPTSTLQDGFVQLLQLSGDLYAFVLTDAISCLLLQQFQALKTILLQRIRRQMLDEREREREREIVYEYNK